MQLLVYLILYPFFWIISILPFPILYKLSDGIYFLMYRIIKYRKRTVRQNLALALPHKSNEERNYIEKQFYKHLCDMFLEMIKTMSISRDEIDKRFVYTNLELYKELEKKDKSIAIMIGHYATYEWVISINKFIDFTGYAIYKKIANKYFDKLVKDIRLKFKSQLITTKETYETIEKNHLNNKRGVYGFASDQSPKVSKALHWYPFMGIETPIHVGAETLAKKYDLNIIFLRVKKIKRGYYQATFDTIFEEVNQIPNYQISEAFIKMVEKQILEAPEYYLWTHKRWKYKKSEAPTPIN